MPVGIPTFTLLTYSEVEEVSGYVGNFKVKVRKKARYVDEDQVHRLRPVLVRMSDPAHPAAQVDQDGQDEFG